MCLNENGTIKFLCQSFCQNKQESLDADDLSLTDNDRSTSVHLCILDVCIDLPPRPIDYSRRYTLFIIYAMQTLYQCTVTVFTNVFRAVIINPLPLQTSGCFHTEHCRCKSLLGSCNNQESTAEGSGMADMGRGGSSTTGVSSSESSGNWGTLNVRIIDNV